MSFMHHENQQGVSGALIVFGIAVVVIVGLVVFASLRSTQGVSRVVVSRQHAPASVVLTPNVYSDGRIEIEVHVRSFAYLVDGVDVVLLYDPTKVQLAGALVDAVAPTGVFPQFLPGDVDAGQGVVRFSLLSLPSKPTVIEDAHVATVVFEALQSGNTTISLRYEDGASSDTNIASGGQDILGHVGHAEIFLDM